MSDKNDSPRIRIVEWQDPQLAIQAAWDMDGQEYIQAYLAGTMPMPPICALLGMDIVEVGEGRVIFAMHPGEYLCNPSSVVQGGATATIMDAAMACAITSKLPKRMAMTTLDLDIKYVRAISLKVGLIRCEAEVVHLGSRTATAQARIVDGQGKLYAHGTSSCLLLKMELSQG